MTYYITHPTGTGTWICWECRDYNLDTAFTCAYCGLRQDSFSQWLHAVDVALRDSDTSRDKLPYQLHQWWDIWDASVEPHDAVTTALLFQPGANKPWPEHAAYTPKYLPTYENR